MSAPTFNRQTRASHANPCKICRKPDYCVNFDDGWTLCQRIESPRFCASTGGYFHWTDPGEPHGTDWRDHLPPPPTPARAPEPPIDANLRDRAFRAQLAACPLSPEHWAALASRGLSSDAIKRHGYGTMPADPARRATAAQAIIAACGEDAFGHIPGLYRGPHGAPALAAAAGIIVPIRDGTGRIQGIQIRADDPTGGKYRWQSSPDLDGGARSGAPLHLAQPATRPPQATRIGITEGAIKGNVAADRLGFPIISIAGVNATADVLPLLQEVGATEVVLMYDQDSRTNEQVARAEARLADELIAADLTVCRATWPAEHKGIDDALTAGVLPVLESYRPPPDMLPCPELRRRYDELRDLHSAVMAVLGNKELNPAERIVAVMQIKNLAVEAQRVAPGEEVHIPAPRIAEQAGVSISTVASAIKTLERGLILPPAEEEAEPEPVQIFTKTVRWVKDDVSRATGEVSDKKKAFYRYTGDPRPIAQDLRVLARVTKINPRKHGGRPDRNGCPEHPNAPVIVRTTRHCQVCDRDLGLVSERIEPPATDLLEHHAEGDFVWADRAPSGDPGVNQHDAHLLTNTPQQTNRGVNQHHADFVPDTSPPTNGGVNGHHAHLPLFPSPAETFSRSPNLATSHNDEPAWLADAPEPEPVDSDLDDGPVPDGEPEPVSIGAAWLRGASWPDLTEARHDLAAADRAAEPSQFRRATAELGAHLEAIAQQRGRQPVPKPSNEAHSVEELTPAGECRVCGGRTNGASVCWGCR